MRRSFCYGSLEALIVDGNSMRQKHVAININFMIMFFIGYIALDVECENLLQNVYKIVK